MQIDAAATDSTSAAVYVQQEGAYVLLSMTEGIGTISAMLTPDLADRLSAELSKIADMGRVFGE